MPEADEADETGKADSRFGVWAENVEVLNMFLRLGTQWRYRPDALGGRRPAGFDYAGVAAALALMGVKRGRRAEVFSDLQEMELAALDEWARARR